MLRMTVTQMVPLLATLNGRDLLYEHSDRALQAVLRFSAPPPTTRRCTEPQHALY